jgi:hypothetical protein
MLSHLQVLGHKHKASNKLNVLNRGFSSLRSQPKVGSWGRFYRSHCESQNWLKVMQNFTGWSKSSEWACQKHSHNWYLLHIFLYC